MFDQLGLKKRAQHNIIVELFFLGEDNYYFK